MSKKKEKLPRRRYGVGQFLRVKPELLTPEWKEQEEIKDLRWRRVVSIHWTTDKKPYVQLAGVYSSYMESVLEPKK
jgi:hypothetical protein